MRHADGKFEANGKFSTGRVGPTESYAEWFHLYSWLTSRDAALSMVFRHFLIFHERFYSAPKFSAVAQRSKPGASVNSPPNLLGFNVHN